MKFGLTQHIIDGISSILEQYTKVDKAFIFGSRAKGNYRPDSDIDIAITGQDITYKDITSISVKMDDLNIGLSVDLLDYHSINEPALKEHIDRVGIEFYSRWKEYRFSELLIDESISYGIVQPGTHTEIDSVPIIRVNNIKNGKIITDEIMKVSTSIEEKYLRTRLVGGELLITVVGSVGECAIVPDNLKGCNVARAVSVARIKKDFNVNYIKYAFKTDDLIFQMYGNTNDTVQPTLNLSLLKELKFNLPSFSEQTAIASILSSLDDKIDLLHRQNKTLEQLAETLFRQWFVEEAEENWEVGKLGDVLKSIESGSRPKGGIDPELNVGIPSIGAENINGLGVYDFSKTKFVTYEFFKSMNRGLIKSYDVLIYKDGAYIGRKGMFADGFPYETCTVNEHVFILRGNSRVNQFFLYFLLKENELAQLNANSAQPGLNQESIKSLDIIIPPIELINQFEMKVKILIDKIFFNCKQIRTLTQTRDTLLPKLMSGEVRVEM